MSKNCLVGRHETLDGIGSRDEHVLGRREVLSPLADAAVAAVLPHCHLYKLLVSIIIQVISQLQ